MESPYSESYINPKLSFIASSRNKLSLTVTAAVMPSGAKMHRIRPLQITLSQTSWLTGTRLLLLPRSTKLTPVISGGLSACAASQPYQPRNGLTNMARRTTRLAPRSSWMDAFGCRKVSTSCKIFRSRNECKKGMWSLPGNGSFIAIMSLEALLKVYPA